MSKHKYIMRFWEGKNTKEHRALYNALLSCLDAEETCELFWETWGWNYNDRLSIHKKIANDMLNDYSECHTQLLLDLIEILKSNIKRERQFASISLAHFFLYTNRESQHLVIKSLLLSNLASLRRRIQRVLIRNWSIDYEQIIKEIWQYLPTAETAEIAIYHLDIKFIRKHFQAFEQLIPRHAVWIRLYIRLGDQHPEYLQYLADLDPITYVYVLVKLNKKLSNKRALMLFQECRLDDRLGLLIWCYGKMQLFQVLKKIVKELANSNLDIEDCNGCQGEYLTSSGNFLHPELLNERGVPYQVRVFNCFKCSKNFILHKGKLNKFDRL